MHRRYLGQIGLRILPQCLQVLTSSPKARSKSRASEIDSLEREHPELKHTLEAHDFFGAKAQRSHHDGIRRALCSADCMLHDLDRSEYADSLNTRCALNTISEGSLQGSSSDIVDH